MRVRAVLVALGVTLQVAGGGCGGAGPRAGHPSGERTRAGSAEGGESDRGSPEGSVSQSDRVAYYQLAVAAGFLEGSASAARGARPDRGSIDRSRSQLAQAAQRLAEVRPRDPGLALAARRLRVAIDDWLAAPGGGPAARQAAGAAERATTQTLQAVRAFVRRHPGAVEAIPD